MTTYYEKNKEFLLKQANDYYSNNKETVKKYQKKYRSIRKNKEYQKNYGKEWRFKNKEQMIFDTTKSRARKETIDFNINIADIIIPTNCPILDIPLIKNINGKTGNANSPSIDRIDSSKGYIKGNINIVSFRANTLKNNVTYKEYKLLIDYIIKFKIEENLESYINYLKSNAEQYILNNSDKTKEKIMFTTAKTAAYKNNITFDIKLEDIIIPTVCPVLNIPLNKYNKQYAKSNSPALDRIDMTRGFFKNNLCVISHRAKTLKSDATLDEMNKILLYLKYNFCN